METVGGLICFGAPVILVIAIWINVNWLLGPLNRAAGNNDCPVQFSLADLLSLFILVQFPIGLVRWVADIGGWSHAAEVMTDVMVGAVAVWLWWNTARLLSLAGIHAVSKRCFILIFVVPCLLVVPLAIFVPIAAAIYRKDAMLLLMEIPIIAVPGLLGLFTRAAASAAMKNKDQENREEL